MVTRLYVQMIHNTNHLTCLNDRITHLKAWLLMKMPNPTCTDLIKSVPVGVVKKVTKVKGRKGERGPGQPCFFDVLDMGSLVQLWCKISKVPWMPLISSRRVKFGCMGAHAQVGRYPGYRGSACLPCTPKIRHKSQISEDIQSTLKQKQGISWYALRLYVPVISCFPFSKRSANIC